MSSLGDKRGGDAQAHSTEVANGKKVIVAGAGLAGLACAYELAKKGHSVHILEARPRVGGRIETLREPFTNDFFAEAGAYWLNDKHTVAISYINEVDFGSALEEIPLEDNYLLCHIRNKRVEAHLAPTDAWPEDLELASIEKQIGVGGILGSIFCDRGLVGDPREPGWPPDAVRAKYGNMNFLEFLRSPHRIRIPKTEEFKPYLPSEGAIELIRPWFAWWDDLESLSALAMIQYGIIGQRLGDPRDSPVKWFTTKNGMECFSQRFEEKCAELNVSILKNTPVVAIKSDKASVTATCLSPSGEQHSFTGDHLICALPLTTLKNVQFIPSLSAAKRELIREVRYASVSRLYVQSKKNIMDMRNGAGYTDLPIGNLLDMSFRHKNGPGRLLQGFMIGQHARRFAQMNQEEKKTFALEQLTTIFPRLTKDSVERFGYKCWDNDPWALGAYPALTPEQFILAKETSKPEGRIQFAGEHTSEYSAWMEGALRSGHRAAREVDPDVPDRP